jgi:Rap1a immunity proteins
VRGERLPVSLVIREGFSIRLRALIVAIGLLWPSSGFSEEIRGFVDGNQLYERCNKPDDFCAGYVAAVSDALGPDQHVCIPNAVTVKQAADVITNYLRDHPEQRHYAAWGLGLLALRLAFPCN